MMEHKLRRVVTGHDTGGRLNLAKDGQHEAVASSAPPPQRVLFEVWSTTSIPSVEKTVVGSSDSAHTGTPEPSTSEIRVVDMPPGHTREMHRTDTVDYGIVLDGEVYLELENE